MCFKGHCLKSYHYFLQSLTEKKIVVILTLTVPGNDDEKSNFSSIIINKQKINLF